MNAATRALLTVTAILAIAPATPAQDADGTHRVRPGDTLWDLAARYLADPFRWPELYDLNVRVVEDPHWIFPGETLRLPGAVEGGNTGMPRAEGRPEGRPGKPARETERAGGGAARRSFGPTGQYPEGSVFRVDPSAPSYGDLSIEQNEASAVVSPSDFYGAPILADQQSLALPGVTSRVVAEAHPDIKLPRAARLNDQVVIAIADADLEIGDYLKAVHWGRTLGSAGRVLYTVGVVRVTRTYPTRDSVRAEVVQIFGDYRVGDEMVRAEDYPVVKGQQAEPETNGPLGTVIAFTVDQRLLSTGESLFLDLGADDGIQVGDVFAVFSTSMAAAETALLEDRLTTVRVVHVSPGTSTALVTEVRDAGMSPGAPVRRVERMPS